MAKLTIIFDGAGEYDRFYPLRSIKDTAYGSNAVVTVADPGDGYYPNSVTLEGTPKEIEEGFGYHYDSKKAVIEAAERFESAEYWDEVRGIVKDITERAEAGEFEDTDALTEALESSCEVIYYSDATKILRFTDNSDVMTDEGLQDDSPGADNRCLQAMLAQLQDVRDLLFADSRWEEEWLEEHRPLSDDEKEEALAAYALIIEERGAETDQPSAIWDCALDLTGYDERRNKVIAFLEEHFAALPTA